MTILLASLKDALSAPFPVDVIQFLPKSVREVNGRTVCTAFPYANKRVYEDCLNTIAYGEWSTPFVAPCLAGNRLIVPVTVVICGVPHTDYGEAFLEVPGKGGTTREDENTTTEAYSQGFRRACSHFGLGRYLYDLQKVTLPFDPKTRQIALTTEERLAWVEKLYKAQHILPTVPAVGAVVSVVHQASPSGEPAPEHVQPQIQLQAPQQQPPSTGHAQGVSSQAQAQQAQVPQGPAQQPVEYPQDIFLDWVAMQVKRDAVRIQDICSTYRVRMLSQLTDSQREDLTKRLQRQASQSIQIGAAVSAVSQVPTASSTSLPAARSATRS
jgi:hypothetical protein